MSAPVDPDERPGAGGPPVAGEPPVGRREQRENDGRPPVGRSVAGRAVEAVVGLAVVVLACALSVLGAPTPLRALVALPVLLLVAGRAVTVLVLGRDRAVLGSARRSVVDEDTLRLVAPLLFGVIAALGSILVLGLVLRVRLTTTSVVVALGVVAAALHLAATLGRRTPSPRTSRRRVALLVQGIWLPSLVAVVLLVAATGGARAVEAQRVERYTQLTLLDPSYYDKGSLTAAPGARVTLGWVLRGYDEGLPDRPPVTVTVAGAPASGLQSRYDAPPADGTDASAARAGTVSLLAPTTPGLSRVALTVGAGDGAQTLYLLLEVAS